MCSNNFFNMCVKTLNDKLEKTKMVGDKIKGLPY